MPLTATFLADFSSFMTATAGAVESTKDLEQAASAVGPAIDKSMGDAAASVEQHKSSFADFGKGMWNVAKSQELQQFAGDVKSVVSGYIAEFAEAETATAKMTAALVASGQTAPAVAAGYGEIATKLQAMSGFTDEAITDAQTLLITLGEIKPDNMERTLEATTNLARGMGIDLVSAAKLVAKAAQTDGEELGKLKLILGDSIPEGAKFTDVLDGMFKVFGGQNAAHMATSAGQMDALNNSMSDINETVGGVLTENLKSIMGLFQSLPEGVQTFAIAVVGIGTALAPVLVSLSSLIALVGGAGLGTAIAGMASSIATAGATILAWIGPVGWIALAVIALAALIYKYWDEIVGFTKYLWEQMSKFFGYMLDLIKNFVTGIGTWLGDKLMSVFNGVLALPGKVVDAFQWMYDKLVGHSIVPNLVVGVGMFMGSLWEHMVKPVIRTTDEVVRRFNSMYGHIAAGGEAADAAYGASVGGARAVWGGGARTPVLDDAASAASRGSGAAGVVNNITINMTGMLGADDPQTRAALKDAVSDALMQGMRGSRLMGTA